MTSEVLLYVGDALAKYGFPDSRIGSRDKDDFSGAGCARFTLWLWLFQSGHWANPSFIAISGHLGGRSGSLQALGQL